MIMTSLTRRDFLTRSALAAGATALGTPLFVGEKRRLSEKPSTLENSRARLRDVV